MICWIMNKWKILKYKIKKRRAKKNAKDDFTDIYPLW